MPPISPPLPQQAALVQKNTLFCTGFSAAQLPVQKMHHLCTILPDKSLPVQKMPHLCTGLPGRRLLVQKNTLSCTNLSGKRNPVPNASIFDTGSNSLPKRQLSTTESPHYV